MMVLEYAKNGNLRNYLKTNFSNLKWRDKLNFLNNIAWNLYIIHSNKYIDADPEKRPYAYELWNIIHSRSKKYFINADKIISQESFSETAINPEAIYTSRFMSFTNLSRPINSTRVQAEDPEGKNNYN